MTRTPQLEELFDGQNLQTARKLISVEDIPTWEELLELFGHFDKFNPKTGQYNSWNTFCDDRNIFHAFSREFVQNLADEIKNLDVRGKIVEVSAGNGKLSYWLNQFGVPSIATDEYLFGGIPKKSEYVERLPIEEALSDYQPELVIGCWLLKHSENGLDALDSPYTRFYLDIGEGPDGCTGSQELWERKNLTIYPLTSTDPYSLSQTDIFSVRHSFARLFTKTNNVDNPEVTLDKSIY